MLLNCSNKAAKPGPAVVLSIADCCFVVRGDEGGDDDNDDELLIFAVVGLCMAVRAGFLFLTGASAGSINDDDDDDVTAAVVNDFPLCIGWLQ